MEKDISNILANLSQIVIIIYCLQKRGKQDSHQPGRQEEAYLEKVFSILSKGIGNTEENTLPSFEDKCIKYVGNSLATLSNIFFTVDLKNFL